MRRRAVPTAWILWLAAVAAVAEVREVVVPSEDGFSLTASLWEAEDEAPGILLLHQCDSDRTMYDELGEKLAAAGFRVLAPDFRGLGASKNEEFDLEKAGSEADWDRATEKFGVDVEAAFRHLGGVTGVLGASCGGLEAVHLATAHPEVTRVALLSARLDTTGERDAMRLSSQQLLFIAGKGDTGAARPAGTLAYRKRSASTLMLFEGEAHGHALFAQEPELLDDIVAWFSQDSSKAAESP